MLIPRQLAPTVGPAHGGVEFLEGSSTGIEKLATDRLKKSRHKNIYINFKFLGPDRKKFQQQRAWQTRVYLCSAMAVTWIRLHKVTTSRKSRYEIEIERTRVASCAAPRLAIHRNSISATVATRHRARQEFTFLSSKSAALLLHVRALSGS